MFRFNFRANKLLTKKVYHLVSKKQEFDLNAGYEPYPYVIIIGSGVNHFSNFLNSL